MTRTEDEDGPGTGPGIKAPCPGTPARRPGVSAPASPGREEAKGRAPWQPRRDKGQGQNPRPASAARRVLLLKINKY